MIWIFFLNILAKEAVNEKDVSEKINDDENFSFKVHDSIFDTLGSDLLKRKHGFVAELLTNAGDALKKLKYHYKDDTIDIGRDIYIEIYKDNEKNVFKISDTGIGMTKEEITKYIGTIGASGTKECHNKDLVGRFGMGFYSVFREADKVEIHTRKHGSEKGYRVTLTNKSKTYNVKEEDKQEPGTDVIVWLNDNIVLTNEDVQSWVFKNMISDGDAAHYNILIKKTEKEKENEYKAEIQRRNNEIQKKKDELKKKKDEVQKKKDELKNTEELVNEKVEEEIDEKVEEEIDENLYEENIVIDDYRILKLAPWTDKDDFDELKRIYKERYNKDDLEFAKKVNFNVKQKNDKGKEWNTRFDALIFMPKVESNMMMMMQENKKGEIEMFVGGSKINDPNIKNLSEFLKSNYIMVKSNEAILASTREEFLDSKNTVKNIANALKRKICEILIEKNDETIHKYRKKIKNELIEQKRNGSDALLDKLADIITFETDNGIYCLNKFVNMIEDNNMLIKKIKEDDENETEKDEQKKAKYAQTDDIFFTNINMKLVKDVTNPLFDGVNVPFLFVADIHDEEILNVLKTYKGYKFTNISTKKFENKVINAEIEEMYKETKEEIKNILAPYISDVIFSKRLQKLPFSIIVPENSMSSAYRSVIGENDIENNPFRSMLDPKPILEINTDSEEVKKIKEMVDIKSTDKLKLSVISLYISTCIACRVDPYSKVDAYIDLMNVAKVSLDLPQEEKRTEDDKLANMLKGMNGFKMPNFETEDGKLEENEAEKKLDISENEEETMKNEENNDQDGSQETIKNEAELTKTEQQEMIREEL